MSEGIDDGRLFNTPQKAKTRFRAKMMTASVIVTKVPTNPKTLGSISRWTTRECRRVANLTEGMENQDVVIAYPILGAVEKTKKRNPPKMEIETEIENGMLL